MKTNQNVIGIILAALLVITATRAHAGGRYPMVITEVRGEVQIRLNEPGSRWHKARLGVLDGGPWLLRTGPHSFAHLLRNFRCVDANSLIRINFDSEASIDVLRGQMSAVDGKRGPSLPDDLR
jgi:hypothetical protein